MKELGIVSKDVLLSPRLPTIPAWDKLTPEQQKLSARRMEVYAAMLANMDHHIGRVLDHLKTTGPARQHGGVFPVRQRRGTRRTGRRWSRSVFSADAKKWFFENFDHRPENLGPQRLGGGLRSGVGAGRLDAVPLLQGLDDRGRHPLAAHHRGGGGEKRRVPSNRRSCM